MKRLRVWYWTFVYDLLDRWAVYCWHQHELAKRVGGNLIGTHQSYVRAHRIAHIAAIRLTAARLGR